MKCFLSISPAGKCENNGKSLVETVWIWVQRNIESKEFYVSSYKGDDCAFSWLI